MGSAYQELETVYLADRDTPAADKLPDFVDRALEISAGEDVL